MVFLIPPILISATLPWIGSESKSLPNYIFFLVLAHKHALSVRVKTTSNDNDDDSRTTVALLGVGLKLGESDRR